MSTPNPGPFGLDPIEVPLDRAPLLRVLCQVAWPEQTLLSAAFNQIADEIGVALADAYPTRDAIPMMSVEFDALTGQVRTPASPPSRQWSSLDQYWRVYFTPQFVTLENRGHYTSRTDMTARFRRIVEVVSKLAQVPAYQRVGWRYVNRISEAAEYDALGELVEDSVRGAQVIALPSGTSMHHSMTDSLFRSEAGSLGAKWGFLPPGGLHDSTLETVPTSSWVLDLDAYDDTRSPFSVESVMNKVGELSSMAYGFFRWAVKPEFITRFGGHE
ncbi:TIGR04255 family protein [Lysinimonas soli]|uniref:TIGR04255 family protein n=1 Tax=Lysinimonas soli TaxID=1074233 RepID=A0ABW0NQX1_9MICO